jgi:aspartate/methionine/tyrosine aminotransferase
VKLKPFQLERWLLTPCTYDLASAGITKLKLRDVAPALDPDLILNYGMTNGSERIRTRIAALYAGVSARNVLVTSGTAEANLLAVYRLLEPGDEVVAIVPTYMQCIGLAESLGAVVKRCRLDEEQGYRPDLRELERLVTRKTKLLFCVNPNNPTGTVYSAEEMRQIGGLAESVGAWFLCDGALRLLEAEGERAAAPVEWYTKGIATGSLSKVGITGIRIGWLVGPEELVEGCWADKDYTTLCHSGIGEYLATLALEPASFRRYVDRAKAVIREHRAILGDWIASHPSLVSWVPPVGGHTAFVRYYLDMDSETLARRLLAEAGVLVSPGDHFESPHHLRVRYSCDRDTLVKGLEAFGRFLDRQAKRR